jgi:hypothetical protein
MFTQLLDENSAVWAQRDTLEAPSWDWQAGDVVIQIHSIPIPPQTIPGTYVAIVGMYDRASGQRLPVIGADGATGADWAPAPLLSIIAP